MQVQEVYQSELGIRQNHIMKILTAVTTVCLPLNLIAGWYGMNFFLYAGTVVEIWLSDGSRNQRTCAGITAVAIPPEGGFGRGKRYCTSSI